TRSLVNVSRVDLGLKADNIIMFAVSPELNGYTAPRTRQLFLQMQDSLSAIPGVTGVTSGTVPLLSGNNWGNGVAVEGFRAGPDTDTNSNVNETGPGYFHTLGIPLIAGRDFTRGDALTAPKVAIVNEA